MPDAHKEIWYLIIGITVLLLFFIAVFILILFIGKKRKMLHQQQLATEKIKLQQAQLEKKDAIIEERNRIITDLHDDVGATLSSMQIYGELAVGVWHTQPQESRKMIEKISVTSRDLMNRMGDIIWSMKPVDEERFTLEARLKNYCSELLTPKNISCQCDIDAKLSAAVINPEIRKNLLLIAKEAINNSAKYSGAKKVQVLFKQQANEVLLSITDDGKGFDAAAIKTGNGIGNIKNRCTQLQGSCHIQTAVGKGVIISCRFPIAIISHSVR